MEDQAVTLILDRFRAQDDLIKSTSTGIHRRFDDFSSEFREEVSGIKNRVIVLETKSEPREPRSMGVKSLTVGSLVGILAAAAKWLWGKA